MLPGVSYTRHKAWAAPCAGANTVTMRGPILRQCTDGHASWKPSNPNNAPTSPPRTSPHSGPAIQGSKPLKHAFTVPVLFLQKKGLWSVQGNTSCRRHAVHPTTAAKPPMERQLLGQSSPHPVALAATPCAHTTCSLHHTPSTRRCSTRQRQGGRSKHMQAPTVRPSRQQQGLARHAD